LELDKRKMEITPRHEAVFAGRLCPTCNVETEKVASEVIYPNKPDYGTFYRCPNCKAYVGCHKGGDKALGRVANAVLRTAKGRAHKAFDALWQDGYMKRKEAYKWLAQALGIPEPYTHIGMFGVETCRKVVELSTAKLLELKENNTDKTV